MNAIEDTRHWLERAVIGLNLCPFAKAVHVKEQIRWVESAAEDPEQLLEDLVRELRFLAAADPAVVETTLLIHPHVLTDFLDYNDFLDVADAAVESLGLAGVLQVASFHPDYQFAGTAPDDVGEPQQSLAVSHVASVARGQHRRGGGRLSGGRLDLRAEHRDAAPARCRGLAPPDVPGPLMAAHLRIARPVSDRAGPSTCIATASAGSVLRSFENHAGFDSAMVGDPGGDYHFEFTQCRGHPVVPAPTLEDLAVLYIHDTADWTVACARMIDAGFSAVEPFDPYWKTRGQTFEDPDGYRVVLQKDARAGGA